MGRLDRRPLATWRSSAGISEQDLLTQLSKVLPGLVDKLTPDGQVPNQRDLASRLWQ